MFVDVISSDSSTSGTSAVGDSDGAGESAVGDSVGAKRDRKRPTMRIGKAVVVASRGSERVQKPEGEAAVSASRGSEHKPRLLIPRRKKQRMPSGVQEQQREAAVGASRGSEDPPFEEESHENQLTTFRADLREHAAHGGLPHLSRPEMYDSHLGRPLAASRPVAA